MDRAELVAFADQLLAALRPHASPGRAWVTPPGGPGPLGAAVDGLEGFARSFLLAGFRVGGGRGDDPDNLLDWFATGLANGTDPASAERWLGLREHAQAKVEAASVALILDLTRPWLWDHLDSSVQRNVIRYLADAVGDATYWQNNWVWFRVITQTFLRSVGGPHDLAEICADLTTHDSFIRPGGWLADGARVRKFDHYNGWALQLYPTLWSRMVGADDLAAERRDADLARLDRFLQDAVRMVGADGAPMIQGRSLTYRFATAAPFWVGAIAGVPSVPLGQLRRAATMQMDYFRRHGAPDPAGLLGVGWFGPYAAVAQDYSGPASPYWASKGLLGIAMPADHPVWLADEVPLPIEQHDSLFSVAAAGWLVSATKDDGIVRLVNHGTDGAEEGSELSDAPGYSRLGYSTSTSPLWDRAAWERPGDSAVVLLDAAGRATHRTGMRLLDARVAEGLGVAASTGPVRWMTLPAVVPGSGPGLPGGSEIAGQVTLVSVVRGPWEVRAVRVAQASPKVVSVQVLGWPLDGVADADDTTALVRNARFTSLVRALTGGQPGVSHHVGASPLAEQVAVPSVTMPLTSEWQVALVVLAGPDASTDVVVAVEGDDLRVEWPDGEMDQLRLGFGTPLP